MYTRFLVLRGLCVNVKASNRSYAYQPNYVTTKKDTTQIAPMTASKPKTTKALTQLKSHRGLAAELGAEVAPPPAEAVILVVGDPGSGKSAFVNALAQDQGRRKDVHAQPRT